jgi:hypothetical protein
MLATGIGAVGGLKGLTQFESIFFIDTNSRVINGQKISVSAFIRCRLDSIAEGYHVVCDEGRVNIYEFHGDLDKPEKFAIFKLMSDIKKSEMLSSMARIAVVTDTELGRHDEINAGKAPLYGPHYLPDGFCLLYASADTGQEFLNRVFRVCDRASTSWLDEIQSGKGRTGPFVPMDEHDSVRMRFGWRGPLTIENPVIQEMRIEPGTRYRVLGLKDD